MAQNKAATLIIDETDSSFVYSDGWVLDAPYSPSYQGFTAWARDVPNRTVSCTFYGTSVSFVGNTPADGLTFAASIDDGRTVTIPNAFTSGQIHATWYTPPNPLSDGKHTISLSNLTGAAVDFATITAGPSTPLLGSRLIVDDTDSAIQFSGKWQKSSQVFVPQITLPQPAYGGSTHQTTTAGDSLSFSFTGTAISVFGVFEWKSAGSTIVNYTIDGSPSITSTIASSGSPPNADLHDDQPNVLLFNSDNLSNGDHTLRIDIVQITGTQIYIFDYVTYKSGFSSLDTMPIPVPWGASLSSSTTISASPNATPSSSPSITTKSTTQKGPIIGGVLAGLAVAAILVLLLFCLLRRRRKAHGHKPHNAFIVDAAHTPSEMREGTTSPGQTLVESPHGTPHGRLTPFTLQQPFVPTPTSQSFPKDLKRPRHETSPTASSLTTDLRSNSNSNNSGNNGHGAESIAIERQEIRERLQEMQERMEELQRDARMPTSRGSEDDIAQLQRRIELLVAENAQLQAHQLPPPAY